MKANIKYHVATALLLGFLLVNLSASAQRGESKKKENKKEYKYNQKKFNNSRQATVHGNSHSQRRTQEHDYAYQNNHKHKPAKEYSSPRYNNNERYAYNHPQYGHVYKNFYSSPTKLSHAQGTFYCHSGHYYRYYPSVGYVRVEEPGGYVFATLPGRYERVHYGGNVYFRVGDVFFESCSAGYRIAPQVSFNFSVHL
ncbi:hypothetical protein [Mangrovibacterium lignilyticum]|uniref:hypothetical protein n=1 Tax=Mangrovibacterium lignilyticum TaxID=2668052 RepID=UPI0013D6AD66|nr:hypothetical protein [Mangrovibacterium lignilyticum]